jgi:hypothetical protein
LAAGDRGRDRGRDRDGERGGGDCLLRRVDDAEVGADVQLGGGDQQQLHRGRAGQAARPGQAVQFAQQVGTLAVEHVGQRGLVTRSRGGHHLQEEVVPVPVGADGWFGQPAIKFGSAGRGEPVYQPIRFDLLRLAFGLNQAVLGQPVQHLVEVPDVQPAPLLANGLLKTALQLVAMGRLVRYQGEHRVVQCHVLTLSLDNSLVRVLALSLGTESQ